MNHELPNVQAGLENAEKPEIKLPNPLDHPKTRRVPEKHIFLLYWLCQSLCVDLNKLRKVLKEMVISDRFTCLLRNLYVGQEATVRTGHGTTEWFQIRNEYVKAVYCHPAYLTYLKNTSWETLVWMKHKLESRFPEEIPITSDMQISPPLWQKVYKN